MLAVNRADPAVGLASLPAFGDRTGDGTDARSGSIN
jgi:hypothetical protein